MKKSFRIIYRLMILNIIIVFSLSSCIGNNTIIENLESDLTEIKIGIAIYDGRDTFIQSVCEMIEKYAKQEEVAGGVSITLEVVDGKNNQQIQNGQIEAFINEDYDAIAVNIVDRAQASTIINKAQKANIPLVFFNREPVPEDMNIWENVYYVGAKAEQSGQLQAEILMNAIDQGVEVDRNKDGIIQYAMLEGEPGHQDAILRSYYSINILEEHGHKIENIVSDTGMWRKEESKEKMLEWIEEFGDTIEVIIANNDAMALGAIEALEEEGYFEETNRPLLIGVDGIEGAIEAIKEGKMLGTVFNNADKQGEAILAKIYIMVTGEEPKTIINAEYENKCYHTHYGIIDKYYLNK